MSTKFVCSQCPTILNESERRLHISAQHLSYFPFECTTCNRANRKFLATTETEINDHIAACHNGNNLGIFLLKDQAKEVELNKMIGQCEAFPNRQALSIDSKCVLLRALNLLDGAGTRCTGNAARNGPVFTQVNDENAEPSVNISTAPMETYEPTEQSIASPITENFPNHENSEALNAIMPTTESSVNISTALEHVECIAKIEIDKPSEHLVPDSIINSKSNEVPTAVVPETKPSVNISVVHEPLSLMNSMNETNSPNQSISHKKRRLPDNISNDSGKRRPVAKGSQLTSGRNHSSDEADYNSANSANQDIMGINESTSHRNDRPTTSPQVISSVPADLSQKKIITKLMFVISEGIVCFETMDRTTYNYAPLSEYLSILRESVLSTNGCDVAMQFYPSDRFRIDFDSLSRYRKYCQKEKNEAISLEQLKIFADQMLSIAFLWADFPITAHFGRYQKDNYEMPSQSDICSELFACGRSILKCNKLDIRLENYWPLSIITNVANDCNECKLKLSQYYETNYQLHEEFLEELYERKVLQPVAVTLDIFYNDNKAANHFINKLKERFAHAPQKRFKFLMRTESTNVRKLSLRVQDSTLESLPHSTGVVLIQQRATDSCESA